jgi:hypothetical protein
MDSVTLVHPEETLKVPVLQATNKCSLFQKNVTLAAAPYRVKSSVTLPDFREFVSALEGKAVEITDTNFRGLQRLCEEFGFSEFAAKLSEFRPAMGFQEAADAGGRIAALNEKAKQHDCDIAVLQSELARLSTDFVRLAGEVSALRSVAAPPTPPPPPQPIPPSPQPIPPSPKPIPPSPKPIPPSPKPIPPSPKPIPPSPKPKHPSQRPAVPTAPPLDSRIISDIPAIFAEFKMKRFSLLWRGSRDGFKAKEFHRRCDGHANTLTVILDTKGNIFGGFTPVAWESRVWNSKYRDENNCFKADDSQKSFLFTLKNPDNIPARRFALNAEKKQRSIQCDSDCGPWFGSPCDIGVSDRCNANTDSYTAIVLPGMVVFTGSRSFQVKEIEVFEITG